MKAVYFYLILTVFLESDALELAEDCQWNYTLQNKNLEDVYHVEVTDLGNDCQDLYLEQPYYQMKSGRHYITVRIEDTTDPKKKRINITWGPDKVLNAYLLILKLKLPKYDYYSRSEDTKCISITTGLVQHSLQSQEQYSMSFDCIQVPTGTLESVLETTVWKPGKGSEKCQTLSSKQEPCFNEPIFLPTNIDAGNVKASFSRPSVSKPYRIFTNDCCSRNVSPREIKVVQRDNCSWVLSVNKVGFSLLNYRMKGLNTLTEAAGKLLPTKQEEVLGRIISVNNPDVYKILVSFRCRLDIDGGPTDYFCFEVPKTVNASLCTQTQSAKTTEKTPIKIEPLSVEPWVITVVTLGSFASAVAATVTVFFVVRNKLYYCCKRPYRQPQNNLQRNVSDVSGALLHGSDETQETVTLKIKADDDTKGKPTE